MISNYAISALRTIILLRVLDTVNVVQELVQARQALEAATKGTSCSRTT